MSDSTTTVDIQTFDKIALVRALGAVVVSVIGLAAFITIGVLAYNARATSPDLFGGIVGTAGSIALLVVGYWLGSSSGSAAKDQLIAKQLPPQQTLASSTTTLYPAQATTTVSGTTATATTQLDKTGAPIT